jgi:hypothetical protein
MGELTPQPPEEPDDDVTRADTDPPYVPGERPRNSWVAPGASDLVRDPSSGHPPGGDEPTRGRRVLARIPGLSRLAEQSGWVGNGDDEPAADPGWVFHEGDGEGAFEGWLFHYADGTMVDADGHQYAFPDAATPEPQAEPAADVAPDPEAEPEPEPEAASEPESAPEPELAPAALEPTPEPEPAPAAADVAPTPADIPRFVEYSPTSVRGYALGAVFLVAAVTGVLTLFLAVSEDSSAALVIAGGCVVLALVAWWALLSWKPTVVSIREGVLDITRGERSDRFELTDPATVVEFRGRPGSPSWTATVKHVNAPRTILRSSHVKPRQFEQIVRHHRAQAQGQNPVRPDQTTTG